MDFHINPGTGQQFVLNLQEGSLLHSPSPDKQALSLPICIYGYGYFIAGPDHYTDRTKPHPFHQIFITHRGRGRFIVDGCEYIAEPGTVLLLDCSKPHRYESFGGVWEHEWVNFIGTACPAYYNLINPDGFRIFPLNGNREIPAILREIRDLTAMLDPLRCVQAGTGVIRLLDAIYALSVQHQRERLRDRQQNILRSVRYMEEHYMEPLTLDMLAQSAYLSRYYYLRSFRQYMGVTPGEHLTQLRISHARQLLLATRLTVEEIGWQTGFGGSKNLIRHFRQATGLTPGEFRRTEGSHP